MHGNVIDRAGLYVMPLIFKFLEFMSSLFLRKLTCILTHHIYYKAVTHAHIKVFTEIFRHHPQRENYFVSPWLQNYCQALKVSLADLVLHLAALHPPRPGFDDVTEHRILLKISRKLECLHISFWFKYQVGLFCFSIKNLGGLSANSIPKGKALTRINLSMELFSLSRSWTLK